MILFKKSLFCLVLLAGLLTLELIARFFFPGRISPLVVSQNDKLVYELNPDYPGINRLGMRDREIQPDLLTDVVRIAAIGDSHTYSAAVFDTEQTWPSRLEQRLNQGEIPARVRVLNFGVPGYNTAQELEVLRTKALLLNPSLIILQHTINDTGVCNYIHPMYPSVNHLVHQSQLLVALNRAILKLSQKFGAYDWVGEHFPDALLFQEGLVGTREASNVEDAQYALHPPRDPLRVPERYHYMLGEENWRRHISEFAELCRLHQIPVIATGFVQPERMRVLTEEGFFVMTFDQIFKDHYPSIYGYSPERTSSHFNVLGNSYIAAALSDYISEKFPLVRKKANTKLDISGGLERKYPHLTAGVIVPGVIVPH